MFRVLQKGATNYNSTRNWCSVNCEHPTKLKYCKFGKFFKTLIKEVSSKFQQSNKQSLTMWAENFASFSTPIEFKAPLRKIRILKNQKKKSLHSKCFNCPEWKKRLTLTWRNFPKFEWVVVVAKQQVFYLAHLLEETKIFENVWNVQLCSTTLIQKRHPFSVLRYWVWFSNFLQLCGFGYLLFGWRFGFAFLFLQNIFRIPKHERKKDYWDQAQENSKWQVWQSKLSNFASMCHLHPKEEVIELMYEVKHFHLNIQHPWNVSIAFVFYFCDWNKKNLKKKEEKISKKISKNLKKKKRKSQVVTKKKECIDLLQETYVTRFLAALAKTALVSGTNLFIFSPNIVNFSKTKFEQISVKVGFGYFFLFFVNKKSEIEFVKKLNFGMN